MATIPRNAWNSCASFLFWLGVLLKPSHINGVNNFFLSQPLDYQQLQLNWDLDFSPATFKLEYRDPADSGSNEWIPIDVPPSALRNGSLKYPRTDLCTELEFRLEASGEDSASPFKSKRLTKQMEELYLIRPSMQITSQALRADGSGIHVGLRWELPNFPGASLVELTPEVMILPLYCASGPSPLAVLTSLTTADVALGPEYEGFIKEWNTCFISAHIPKVVTSCGREIQIDFDDAERNNWDYFVMITLNCQSVSEINCPPRPEQSTQPYCNPVSVKSFDLGNNVVLVAWKFPEPGPYFPSLNVSYYEVNYGAISNKSKPIFFQSLQSVDIIKVDGDRQYAVLRAEYDCEEVYRVQVCAVFGPEGTSVRSWHPVNSFHLASSRSCRQPAQSRFRQNLSGILSTAFSGYDLDIQKVVSDLELS